MPRLHLYSHAADAWESGLGEWLRRRSLAACAGGQTWFVTNSFSQSAWIREKALQSGLALFGIQFMSCRGLRQRLCRLARLPSPVFGRETLRLLVDAALTSGQTQNLSRRGNALLEALDDLAASGWLDEFGAQAAFHLLGLPSSPLLTRLVESDLWRPRTDRKLKRLSRSKRSEAIGFYGFDAIARHETELLLAALRGVSDGRIWVHQPLSAESPNFDWIELLENQLGVEPEICPAGSTARPFESFVEAWNGAAPQDIATPRLLRSATWSDQITAIVEYVAGILAKGVSKIVIAVPENSLTGPAIIRELVSRDIAVTDDVREPVQPSAQGELTGLVTRFLTEERTIEVFLAILRRCLRNPNLFGRIRDAIFLGFETHQTREIKFLVSLPGLPEYVPQLFEALPAAPEAGSWDELVQLWQRVRRELTTFLSRWPEEMGQYNLVDVQSAVPWDEVGSLLQGGTIPASLFFQFVRDLLSTPPVSQTGTVSRYANVVVTTGSRHFGCTCDYLVLADSHADCWPAVPLENPILRDAAKKALKNRLILTTNEERRLYEERVLHLIYHARQEVLLSWYQSNEKGEKLVPSNWVTFCDLTLKPELLCFAPKPPAPLVPAPSIQRLRKIHLSRIDPDQPFDDYFLNFETALLPKRAWKPTDLQLVRETPGTFAFKSVFRCEMQRDQAFARNQKFALGTLVHRLLEKAFDSPQEFVRLADALSLSSVSREDAAIELKKRIQSAAVAISEEQSLSGSRLWWRSVLHKAVWIAEQIVQNLSADPERWVRSEYQMTSVDAPGKLYLRGRADLLISDRPALSNSVVTVIDFKSSMLESTFSVLNRSLLQFCGYASLVNSLGAAGSKLELVTPIEAKTIPDFKIAEVQDVYDELVRIQETLCFGRRGNALNRFERPEHLPIATLPLDRRLLAQKRERWRRLPRDTGKQR